MTDYFAGRIADRYDDSNAEMHDPQVLTPTVDFLARLAGDGRALELGIGTGRVALPLGARGIEVCGIDASADMVARLREKPHGDAIEVAIGDFSSTRVGGSFRVAYLVYNTIMNLTSQDAQVACFRNVASHLEPGGTFVIEVSVPELQRLPPGETVRPFAVSEDRLGFDEVDVVTQGLRSHHFWRQDGRWSSTSLPFRYVWPSELDLMARIAGMSLRERWDWWDRGPFTAQSISHVSVWEMPTD